MNKVVIKKPKYPPKEGERSGAYAIPKLKVVDHEGHESEIEAVQPILSERRNKLTKRTKFRLPEPQITSLRVSKGCGHSPPSSPKRSPLLPKNNS